MCRLNLMAGRRARDSAAYAPAANFLRTGLEFLPADPWRAEPELTRVYGIRVLLYSHQAEQNAAIESGLECLRLYGLEVNLQGIKPELIRQDKIIRQKMRGRDPAELSSLPAMDDEESIALVEILSAIAAASYIGNSALSALVVMYGVVLSLDKGNAPFSPYHYASYGSFLTTLGSTKAPTPLPPRRWNWSMPTISPGSNAGCCTWSAWR